MSNVKIKRQRVTGLITNRELKTWKMLNEIKYLWGKGKRKEILCKITKNGQVNSTHFNT